MWRSNNTLLKSDLVKEEIKGEVKKHIETNENNNMTYENLQHAAKAVIRGKFISLQAYRSKQPKIAF